MFTGRFRLPGPALVISMVALTVVLGGTAVAATTSGDTKADTKLIKKLAPSLTAGNAKALGGLPASAYVQKAATLTGHWSCAGTAFENAFGADGYSVSGSEKYPTGGHALFRCSVDLPDGATVTGVSFGVQDDSVDDASCELWRTNTATSIGDETLMAATSSSGTPGATKITSTSISAPVIDNANYTYFVQCDISGSDTTMGLYGANIAYTVSAQHAAVHPPATRPSRSSSSSAR